METQQVNWLYVAFGKWLFRESDLSITTHALCLGFQSFVGRTAKIPLLAHTNWRTQRTTSRMILMAVKWKSSTRQLALSRVRSGALSLGNLRLLWTNLLTSQVMWSMWKTRRTKSSCWTEHCSESIVSPLLNIHCTDFFALIVTIWAIYW